METLMEMREINGFHQQRTLCYLCWLFFGANLRRSQHISFGIGQTSFIELSK